MSVFPVFNRLKMCRYGQMLYNIHDMYLGRMLELYGEYSEGEVDLFRQIVEPGHVVMDVGANIGAHTVFFAQQVGISGLVIAFEPQRVLFQTLCANIALNSITNVVCVQYAVGAQHGKITVPLLEHTQLCNFASLSLGSHESGESVPVVPLDAYGLASCRLIKVDVEGMEEQVLRGATRLIERCNPILYVEDDREEKSEGLMRFIDSLGYAIYSHLPLYFNPRNFLGNPENAFPNTASKNLLCVSKNAPQTDVAKLRGELVPVQVGAR